MITTLVLAVLNLALTLVWVWSSLGDTLNSTQYRWYVEVPLLFCVIPIAALVICLSNLRHRRNSTRLYVAATVALVINLAGLFVYFSQSGGGL